MKCRIAIGKEESSERAELLRGKIESELKKRIAKTLIWSTVLYAAETWTLRIKVDIQRLESFKMWIWRRLMKSVGLNTDPNSNRGFGHGG